LRGSRSGPGSIAGSCRASTASADRFADRFDPFLPSRLADFFDEGRCSGSFFFAISGTWSRKREPNPSTGSVASHSQTFDVPHRRLSPAANHEKNRPLESGRSVERLG
jgi:hypothetical protein